jgi:ATP-dependent Clp protease adaptor protein ClpS
MSENTKTKEDVIIKLKRPKMYRVILNNDDYTTMEFVVEVLVSVFHKNATEATIIMMDVHEKGKGIVGTYTYDIARTKVLQVEEMASEREYPLRVSIEEE